MKVLRPIKVVVIGAGALGTFYSAMLSSSGQDVTLVCREKDRDVLEKGIRVTGAKEVAARPSIATAAPPSDLIFVTVKAHDVEGAVKGIRPKPDTLVVVIHNGLGPEEAAASILGKGRVAVGLVYGGATYLEPGKVELAGYSETVLGSADPEARAKLGIARDVLEKAGLKARIAEDIRASQWEKLCTNVAINPITALTGINNGTILEVPELTVLAGDIVGEAAAVAEALGIRMAVDPLENTIRVIKDTYGNRSSMLQDVTRGKRTEIDALNGKICELGRKAGVSTPYNDAITALVKGLEFKNKVRGI